MNLLSLGRESRSPYSKNEWKYYKPRIFTSSLDWPLVVGVMKAELYHASEVDEVLWIDRIPGELFTFIGLVSRVEMSL